jgi:hypothetical protein
VGKSVAQIPDGRAGHSPDPVDGPQPLASPRGHGGNACTHPHTHGLSNHRCGCLECHAGSHLPIIGDGPIRPDPSPAFAKFVRPIGPHPLENTTLYKFPNLGPGEHAPMLLVLSYRRLGSVWEQGGGIDAPGGL